MLAALFLLASCGISDPGDDGGGILPSGELEIRDVRVTDLSDTLANIEWTTTRQTIGMLSYGTGTDLLSATLPSPLASSHHVTLEPLVEATDYWYRIEASTALGGERVSSRVFAIRTPYSPDRSDTTAPAISDIQVTGITPSSATIHWNTDDRTTGSVLYGQTVSYGLAHNEPEFSFSRSHAAVLTGLVDDEEYHFRIQATNRAALTTISEDAQFRTGALPSLGIEPDTVRVLGNSEFEFGIEVSDVTNLAGLEFTIVYNASMIEILSVREGPFFGPPHEGFLFIKRVPGSNQNPIQYNMTWKIVYEDGQAVGTDANGTGIVAVVRALAKGVATSSDLIIDTTPTGDGNSRTRLLDHNRNSIPFKVHGGKVLKSE